MSSRPQPVRGPTSIAARASARCCSHGPGADRDRGSASLWLLAVGLLLLAAGLAGAAIGDAQLARHQAQAAADLGALAGAARAHHGAEVACARAADLVQANGGILRACRLAGLELTVTVEVVAAVAGRPATATARAGPLRSAPGPYPDDAGAG